MPSARETVLVDQFTDGILGPEAEMLGPVKDGGTIVANTAPGCWGPMITPSIRGGHEVTKPVLVEGAEVGDAIVLKVRSIQVTSQVTASGVGEAIPGRFHVDPILVGRCPGCGALYPETRLEGIGEDSVVCAACGAHAAPYRISNGYTMAFDSARGIGVSLDQQGAERAARNAAANMAIPDRSVQNPIAAFAPHHLPGMISRMRPFIGQLGTTPASPIPDSYNAGDFGQYLVDAPHDYGMTAEQLEKDRTDGHLDIGRVREGTVLICPVKIPGGGVYLGDVHAMQGDGEIAGHTTDVSATVVLQVEVIKGLNLDGPIFLPRTEDLPYLARPITAQERRAALALAERWGMTELEETGPVSFVGTGFTLNAAVDNGIKRAAEVLDLSVEEVMNRCTVTGGLEIGRAPGVVQVTFLAPAERLKRAKIWPYVQQQYQL